MRNIMREKKRWIIFAIVSVLIVLIFSETTSPLFGEPYAGDSAMFQTIGKYWAQGVLPYTGLWDSKGPVIFAINAFGYVLTGSKTGIFIIQVICLFISQIYIYKILKTGFSQNKSIILTLFVSGIMLLDYDGNCTEEFLLPLLCASFYCMLQEVDKYTDKQFEHSPSKAFLYGITFSFCLLTRLTNALGLCAGIFIISVGLIAGKKWKNLLYNIGSFLAGMSVLLLPFVIYFYSKGILYDVVYGTLLYNIDYAANSNLLVTATSFGLAIEIIIGYSGSIFMVFIGVIQVFSKKRRFAGLLETFVGLITAVWLFNSNGYLHYGLIALPYYAIVFVEFKRLYFEFRNMAIRSVITCFFGMFICLSTISIPLALEDIAIVFYNKIYVKELEAYYRTEAEVISVIPEDERNSFVAYNANDGIYLQQNLRPYYRFFTMQDWAASRSTSLEKLLLDTYTNGDAKWIFVEGDPSSTLIYEVLQRRYECVAVKEKPFTGSMYYLYRLKDSRR